MASGTARARAEWEGRGQSGELNLELKGLFDEFGKDLLILVSGSVRLDLYRYAGDSLQGRYHYYRLHLLSVAEPKIDQPKDFLQ